MTQAKQTLHDGYRGLALLMALNWDRFLFPAAIAFALMLAGYFGTL